MSYIDLTTIILLEVYIQTNINRNDYFPSMCHVEGYENTGMNAFLFSTYPATYHWYSPAPIFQVSLVSLVLSSIYIIGTQLKR